MSRYIDADALGIGKASRNAFTVPEYADGWNSAVDIIFNAPTADVVEVVRYEEERKYHFEMSRTRIAEAKADTVRKMQKRLKANKVCRDGLSFKVVDFDTIDQIAKEMLGGDGNVSDQTL